MQHLNNPNHLQQLAAKYGIHPNKTYGQNFLVDEDVIRKIVKISNVGSTDTIVEVGPGFGILTLALAGVSGRIISFEIEKKLNPYWEEVQKRYPNIGIVWGNVLKTFPKMSPGLPEHYKVVANLPYQITSAAIRLFLEAPNPPESLTLMVQKEVAERICAPAGEMSILSVSVQYYADAKIELGVPASCFWPPPKVDSAVVSMRRRVVASSPEETAFFFRVVKAGFVNRRKLLIKNLENHFGKKHKKELESLFEKLNLLHTARAQELSVRTWGLVAKELKDLLKK